MDEIYRQQFKTTTSACQYACNHTDEVQMLAEHEKYVVSSIACPVLLLLKCNYVLSWPGSPVCTCGRFNCKRPAYAYTKAGRASEEIVSSGCNSCVMLEPLCMLVQVSRPSGVPLPFPQMFSWSRTEELGFGDELGSLLHKMEERV
jgi:hypothetical protein